MDRIVFLNDAFVPSPEARISVMDRGFLFADGIYEVSAVLDGGLVDNENHLDRLDRCLSTIRLANPLSRAEWRAHQKTLIAKNGLQEGLVYMQVSRGAAPEREFAFPAGVSPTVVMFTQAKRLLDAPLAISGAAVITVPDIRWARRDIKSVALLAQVLAKQQAAEAGVAEAFMVEDGMITEGGSSNAFIITGDGVIVTRPLSHSILPGITRSAILHLAHEQDLRLEERAFSLEDLHAAAEVFFTSATSFVMPVVKIDGRPVGAATPGPLTARLRALYIDLASSDAKASLD